MNRTGAAQPACERRLFSVVLLLLLTLGTQAQAQTVRVSDATTLRQALQQASPGTTITLTPGDYGRLDWTGGRGVILQGQTGVVLRGLDLQNARDISFVGITFDYRYARGDAPHLRPFAVTDSQGITFDGVIFDGDLAADGYPTAYGLGITGSRTITLSRSRLTGFLRGLVAAQSSGLRITGNDVTAMRSDGLDFAQVTDVQITGNHIHDFHRDLGNDDHADMIQFWTNGTTAPSRDITIVGNVLHAGRGAYTQSIFMRNDLVDRGLAGAGMFYRDVTITGNLIINAHTHGITLGEARGVTITRNTVVQTPAAAGAAGNPSLWVPRIHVAPDARDVTIRDNVVAAINGPAGQGDWQVAGNLLVQNSDPATAGYYAAVFGSAAISAVPQAGAFRLIPPYARPGLGADIAATP